MYVPKLPSRLEDTSCHWVSEREIESGCDWLFLQLIVAIANHIWIHSICQPHLSSSSHCNRVGECVYSIQAILCGSEQSHVVLNLQRFISLVQYSLILFPIHFLSFIFYFSVLGNLTHSLVRLVFAFLGFDIVNSYGKI